jgi:uncharacterized membrane protein YphA (DoxX/SURF4 family)
MKSLNSQMAGSNYALFIVRLGLGLFFLLAGIGHALNFDMTRDGASILTDNTQWVQFLALAATVNLILGGLSLCLGFKVRLGALLLISFLVPAAYLHGLVMEIAANTADVLDVQASAKAKQAIGTLRGIAVQGHQANVMKNLVLALVMLGYAITGAGPISLDAFRIGYRRENRKDGSK